MGRPSAAVRTAQVVGCLQYVGGDERDALDIMSCCLVRVDQNCPEQPSTWVMAGYPPSANLHGKGILALFQREMMFAAFYGIFVGLLMLGWWIFSFVKNQVPEVRTEPIRLSFHLAAEFLTAILLIVSGFGLLFAGEGWALPVYLVAMGMLLYSVIVSPGYFAQRGEWPLVGMFVTLLLLALLSLASLP